MWREGWNDYVCRVCHGVGIHACTTRYSTSMDMSTSATAAMVQVHAQVQRGISLFFFDHSYSLRHYAYLPWRSNVLDWARGVPALMTPYRPRNPLLGLFEPLDYQRCLHTICLDGFARRQLHMHA